MSDPGRTAAGGPQGVPPKEIIIYQSEDKPIRLTGWLLGTGQLETSGRDRETFPVTTRARLFRSVGGKFIWATERISGPLGFEAEPAEVDIERAEARVCAGVDEAWTFRPSQSGKLLEATAAAWREAAKVDPDVQAQQYEAVE